MPNNTVEFVISRAFDAPRDLVYASWVDPNRMAQWWGPRNFKVIQAKLDLRVGGSYHYCIQSPDGMDMWGKFVYREITEPKKLVWVNSFSDKDGNITRHPFSAGWPLEMLTTVTFEEQGTKTNVTVKWLPIGASDAECQTFKDGHASMNMGWTGTMDQLAEYLKTA